MSGGLQINNRDSNDKWRENYVSFIKHGVYQDLEKKVIINRN